MSKPNGSFFGPATTALRNLLTPSLEPDASMVGRLVIASSGCMFPDADGVVTGLGKGFFGEPTLIVTFEDGQTSEVPNILPAESRAIGVRFKG